MAQNKKFNIVTNFFQGFQFENADNGLENLGIYVNPGNCRDSSGFSNLILNERKFLKLNVIEYIGIGSYSRPWTDTENTKLITGIWVGVFIGGSSSRNYPDELFAIPYAGYAESGNNFVPPYFAFANSTVSYSTHRFLGWVFVRQDEAGNFEIPKFREMTYANNLKVMEVEEYNYLTIGNLAETFQVINYDVFDYKIVPNASYFFTQFRYSLDADTEFTVGLTPSLTDPGATVTLYPFTIETGVPAGTTILEFADQFEVPVIFDEASGAYGFGALRAGVDKPLEMSVLRSGYRV